MLNGHHLRLPNVVTFSLKFGNVLIYRLLVCLVLLQNFSNSGNVKIGKYFNNVSCQLNPTIATTQNVTSTNESFNSNSTFELRRSCEAVDPSCTCDSPQKMRCHNPSQNNLNHIIKDLATSSDLYIKMLDWNLPGLEIFKDKIFSAEIDLHLIGLFISSNGTLQRIEDGSFLGLRKNLQILGLSDNNLGPEIPQEIFSLPTLLQLDLSKNKISNLRRPIRNQNTRSLQYLDLSNNVLETINENSVDLFPKSLCTLKLSHNKLTLIGISGANFENIGFLDLSNNNITGSLTSLVFSGKGGKQIESLYLDYNNVDYIGRNSFCGLSRLKNLWLSFNNIDRLHRNSFKCLKHLSYIDLSHNQILDVTRGLFEPLANSLKELILSHNHLSVINPSMSSLPLTRLTYLDLQNNEIIKIEGQSFDTIPSLQTLLLGGKVYTFEWSLKVLIHF